MWCLRSITVAIVIALAGCAGQSATHPVDYDNQVQRESPQVDPIAMALAHPDRLSADLSQDEPRKASELMAFAGIRPGMTVLDLYSGGGYNSELASFIVGQQGEVWAHNNTPYLAFAKQSIQARYTPGRLTNVRRVLAENNELALPPASFDVVLMVMTYHDIYHVHEPSGWTQIDGPALLAELYKATKSGGVIVIVDHRAPEGSPPETGETLHRIDPQLVRQQMKQAGFILDAESEMLANPADDLTLSVFHADIRGKTDKFVMRFLKP